MDQVVVTPQGRELGDELRSLRRDAGFDSGAHFAVQLGWDPSKVSNIEHGKVRASETDLAQYLTACGRDRHSITRFAERSRSIFDPYYAQSLEKFSTITHVERSTTSITSHAGSTIPDLLRTESYAKNIMQRAGATNGQIQAAVRSLGLRQSILRRVNPPDCVFYLSERAIQSVCSLGESALEQLERIRQTPFPIRIVRDGEVDLVTTNFTIYECGKRSATAFIDCDLVKVFTVDEAGLARCRAIVDTISEASMCHADSRKRVSKLIEDKQVSMLLEATRHEA